MNVQGDEPLIPPALIDQVAGLLESNADAEIATLATPIDSLTELMDPNAVKVVTDGQGRALYFSRAPIPWDRDGAVAGVAVKRAMPGRDVTLVFMAIASAGCCALPRSPSPLEQREKLEQLRALENGIEIRVADCLEQPGPDVNTADDFERVSALLR